MRGYTHPYPHSPYNTVDCKGLSKAYAEFGYTVEDVSELTYLYNEERTRLQKMMVKAVYTVSSRIRTIITSCIISM
jgi:hypothetical protein